MSDGAIEKMTMAYWFRDGIDLTDPNMLDDEMDCMRAAVLVLADNVTDEMVRAFREQLEREPRDKWLPAIAEANAIAAAIRSLASKP